MCQGCRGEVSSWCGRRDTSADPQGPVTPPPHRGLAPAAAPAELRVTTHILVRSATARAGVGRASGAFLHHNSPRSTTGGKGCGVRIMRRTFAGDTRCATHGSRSSATTPEQPASSGCCSPQASHTMRSGSPPTLAPTLSSTALPSLSLTTTEGIAFGVCARSPMPTRRRWRLLGNSSACGGSGQGRLGDEPGIPDRAHDSGGGRGPIPPSMTNDTPGEVYVRGTAWDASKTQRSIVTSRQGRNAGVDDAASSA
jgi:hypothetical protein